ncbi:hypothetical protein ACWOFR_05760 [Carnobacterium gallinarum]|uniref:hypothetical protein n=1 Tax=Carnobacterium gallinarum TaxID=2749 RepID=UPI0005548991|nr:hypothetical protein [Carnobacterium gallinarum]
MQKVLEKEQRQVNGGTCWHWNCSVNGFSSTHYSAYSSATYQGGIHAGKYGHQKNMSFSGISAPGHPY